MADLQTAGVSAEWVDKRNTNTGSNPDVRVETAYGNIAAMKARLKALNPTGYTDARLMLMTDNDMTYALRVESADKASF